MQDTLEDVCLKEKELDCFPVSVFDPMENISRFICGRNFSEESGHLFTETEGYSNTLSHMCLSANYLPFYCFAVFHAGPNSS